MHRERSTHPVHFYAMPHHAIVCAPSCACSWSSCFSVNGFDQAEIQAIALELKESIKQFSETRKQVEKFFECVLDVDSAGREPQKPKQEAAAMKNRNIPTRMAALLLAAALLLSLCPAAFAAETEPEAEIEPAAAAETETEPKEIISVRTSDDLAALASACTLDTWSVDKTVELDADISLEGTDFSPHPQLQRDLPRQRPFHPRSCYRRKALDCRAVPQNWRDGRDL